MFRKMTKLAALFAVGGTAAAADWPSLPTKGFITGRPAEQSDVMNGDAIFVAAVKNVVIGKPIPIQIPQYALRRDTHERVFVVQAEDANGIKLVGVRSIDGKEAVVKDTDLDLLGTQKSSP
jgi:hypothetical protein